MAADDKKNPPDDSEEGPLDLTSLGTVLEHMADVARSINEEPETEEALRKDWSNGLKEGWKPLSSTNTLIRCEGPEGEVWVFDSSKDELSYWDGKTTPVKPAVIHLSVLMLMFEAQAALSPN